MSQKLTPGQWSYAGDTDGLHYVIAISQTDAPKKGPLVAGAYSETDARAIASLPHFVRLCEVILGDDPSPGRVKTLARDALTRAGLG